MTREFRNEQRDIVEIIPNDHGYYFDSLKLIIK